ncbi:hypothetical protein [Saccharothrix sp. HUAS TT1]|uniref:hypothetical protein n=1 Tax=Saccharothrix sp. HUAS TT1 TaxID=3231910 RepID=UPI00345C2E82
MALRALVEQARTHTAALRRHSAHPAVRRLVGDVERLAADVDEAASSLPVTARDLDREVVVVPDTPYDPALWHGADDEGVGGHRRHDG